VCAQVVVWLSHDQLSCSVKMLLAVVSLFYVALAVVQVKSTGSANGLDAVEPSIQVWQRPVRFLLFFAFESRLLFVIVAACRGFVRHNRYRMQYLNKHSSRLLQKSVALTSMRVSTAVAAFSALTPSTSVASAKVTARHARLSSVRPMRQPDVRSRHSSVVCTTCWRIST
jgi:hypothetical protein